MVEAENPGTKSVDKLMENVADGSYVIPYFQRGFEWEPSMVSELFQSIIQDYHTGLLLFWELDDQRAKQQEWDPVWGVSDVNDPEQAILDGQQRLSSLYYAISNPEMKFPSRKSYYLFSIDLIEVLNERYDECVPYSWKTKNYRSWQELRENRQGWIESGEVPVCILSASDPTDPNKRYINSNEFREWSTQFVEERSADLPDDVSPWDIRDVFLGIEDYSFVIYPLSSERSMPDICNIFAKVNDTGMSLSTFDLMNAFLYPSGVKLRKNLWEELSNRKLKQMDSGMKESLLKIISLRKQNYCSSKYLYNLIPGEKTVREEPDGTRYEEILVNSGEEFVQLWQKAVAYAESARKKIMNTGEREFGALRPEYVPYTTILPVLAAVLWEANEGENRIEFSDHLARWYWSATFSKDYSGSSDTAMGKDFRDWKLWLSGDGTIEQLSKVDEEFVREMDLASEQKGSGRYNAVICLLALNNAEDFKTGRTLGTGDFTDKGINDHHIFPKNVNNLPEDTATTFTQLKDSILNRTLILDSTNEWISNRPPSTYLPEIMESEGEQAIRSRLAAHFVSDAAFDALLEDDFDGFVQEREAEIKDRLLGRL